MKQDKESLKQRWSKLSDKQKYNIAVSIVGKEAATSFIKFMEGSSE